MTSTSSEQRHRHLDAERFQQGSELSVELDPDRRDRRNAEASELCARLVDGEPRAFVCVFPDDRPQRRVEHGAGVVAEHPLSDRDVAHEVRDAVVVVTGELHHAVYVIAPIDEKPVRSQVGVEIYDFIPTGPALHDRGDRLDGISRNRLLVELLKLTDAWHLDVQPPRGVGVVSRCHGGKQIGSGSASRFSHATAYPAGMTVSSPPDRTGELIGRNDEVARIDAVLDQIREHGGALLIRGDPGIGKSALLDQARGRASALGARILATVGVESESELAFAGLHQLLAPIRSRMAGLPDPQREALDAAFGVNDLVEPDPFRVALAAYRLISDAADSSALLLIADDAHWLDRSSLDALAFLARRLDNEPVVLLAALRGGFSTALEEAGLPTLLLDRLSASDSEKLLDRVASGLPVDVHSRVLAEAAGNPLGLVELARARPETGDPIELLTPGPATLTARLERAFGARLDGLGEDTRLMLLAAALDGRASIEELLSAATLASGNEVALSALDSAAERGLAEPHGSEVRFQHPLIRSAVASTAPPAQRIAMYAALAHVVRDPERRLWHRAAAAVGHDEEVASALDEHAQIARRRGAVMVAAGALERAATLTAEPRRKGERLVRAAELVYDLGSVDVVSRLLGEAESLQVGPVDAARAAWLRQMISGAVWSEKGAAKTFVTIADRLLAGGDADAAVRSLVPIAHRCWWTRSRARTRQYVVDAAEGMGSPGDDPRLLAVMALADPEVTAPSVRRRVARLQLQEISDAVAAMYVGHRLRESGRLRRRLSLPGARSRPAARAGQARPAHAGARPLRVGCHVRRRLGGG